MRPYEHRHPRYMLPCRCFAFAQPGPIGNGPTVNGDVGEVEAMYWHQDGDTWVFRQLQDGNTHAQVRLEGAPRAVFSDRGCGCDRDRASGATRQR
jgi:hypothetical protein